MTPEPRKKVIQGRLRNILDKARLGKKASRNAVRRIANHGKNLAKRQQFGGRRLKKAPIKVYGGRL